MKSLNHGARGEVDGVVLENGDFVRTGPRKAEEAKLAVGQEISVEGYTMKMPDGNTMITFPVKINDKEVSRPRPFGRLRRPSAVAAARPPRRSSAGRQIGWRRRQAQGRPRPIWQSPIAMSAFPGSVAGRQWWCARWRFEPREGRQRFLQGEDAGRPSLGLSGVGVRGGSLAVA